jgi:hypothetical protein
MKQLGVPRVTRLAPMLGGWPRERTLPATLLGGWVPPIDSACLRDSANDPAQGLGAVSPRLRQ